LAFDQDEMWNSFHSEKTIIIPKDPNRVGPLWLGLMPAINRKAMASTLDVEADIAVAAEVVVEGVAGSIDKDDVTLPYREDTEEAHPEARLQEMSLPMGDATTFPQESPTVFCELEINPSNADVSTAETSRPPTEVVSPEDPGKHRSFRMVCPICAKLGEFAGKVLGVAIALFYVGIWLFVLGLLAFSYPYISAAIALAIALVIMGCVCLYRCGKQTDGAIASIRDDEADIAVVAEGAVEDVGGSIGNNDATLPSGKDPEAADVAVTGESDKCNAMSPSGKDLEEADIVVGLGDSIGKDNAK
jgi:hypothetical protein